MRNKTEGSVLKGNVKATCLGFETRVELESDDSPERIAALIKNAENGCFTSRRWWSRYRSPRQFHSTVRS